MEVIKDKIINYFSDADMWINFAIIILKVVVIIIVSRIIIKVVKKSIILIKSESDTNPSRMRRKRTIAKLVSNAVVYSTNFISILLILDLLGFALMPLIAGAGVVGLAIGFGAQNLVKDIITGFFIIFEDQFAVGDVVGVGSVKGTVEEIGIRTTVIKNWSGEVHIIPNGTITEVTNYSLYNSVGVVDISIAYESDMDKAVQVIKETANRLYESNENMVKEPNVLGVHALGASEVIIRVTTECLPNQHFAVCRQLNEDFKKALDAYHIEIPYPKVVNYQRSEKVE